MVSSKIVDKTIPEIEAKMKTFTGDLVRIEYLENCLRQVLPNDIKRFCHLKAAELYANKSMWSLAAKNMEAAAETATSYRDKINFHLKEISYLIKAGDYLLIDRSYKKALAYATDKEKADIKIHLKRELINLAQDLEKKNKRGNALQIYQRIVEIHDLVNEAERKDIIKKIAEICSKLGKIREAMTYEKMLSQSQQIKKDPETNVKKHSYEDLGIEFY